MQGILQEMLAWLRVFDLYYNDTTAHRNTLTTTATHTEDSLRDAYQLCVRVCLLCVQCSVYYFMNMYDGIIDPVSDVGLRADATVRAEKVMSSTGRDASTRRSVYLDYAGSAIADRDLLREAFDNLAESFPRNPHSSASSEDSIRLIRHRLLHFIGADAEQYDVIFTSGATAAIKLIGECFPISNHSALCYAQNSHTSILGLRHFFPRVHCRPRTQKAATKDSPCAATTFSGHYSLVATPAECNFSGCKLDVESFASFAHCLTDGRALSGTTLVQRSTPAEFQPSAAEGRSLSTRWLWLLDIAKWASSSPLNLASIPADQRPHFMCMSFYKIFGYPTGLGALVVRRDVLPILRLG
jgi:molybdenum cofactor sulfurtransferase